MTMSLLITQLEENFGVTKKEEDRLTQLVALSVGLPCGRSGVGRTNTQGL